MNLHKLSNLVNKTGIFLAIFAIFLLTLGINTVNAASITVSPPKHEFNVDPGASISDVISITNGDAADLVLETSVADFIAEGEAGKPSFVEQEDESAFSMSAWVSFPSGLIVVPAGEKIEVPFSIAVPEDAEAGGHFGTVFFSPVTSGTGAVAVKQKVGVLLLVSVSGDVIEKGELSVFGAFGKGTEPDDVAIKNPGRIFQSFPITFATRITNTGNVHIKPVGSITIKNMFGKVLPRIGEELILNEAGAVKGSQISDTIPVNDGRGNVLPESSRVFLSSWKGYGSYVLNIDQEKVITWKGLGFGRYTAELSLAYNGTQFPAQIIHFWIIPWMIILPSLLGLVLIILLIKKMRRSSVERMKAKLREEMGQEDSWT